MKQRSKLSALIQSDLEDIDVVNAGSSRAQTNVLLVDQVFEMFPAFQHYFSYHL